MRQTLTTTAIGFLLLAAACAPAAPAPATSVPAPPKPTAAPAAATSAPAAAASPAAAPAATKPAAQAPTQVTEIKVGVTSAGPENTWLYIADKKGYFAEEGLKLTTVLADSGPALQAALTGGSVDVILPSSLTYLRAVQQNVPIVAVAANSQGLTQALALSKQLAQQKNLTSTTPPDEVAAALKGARIGVSTAGGITDVTTRIFLSQRKLDPDKDVTITPVGSNAAMEPALANGRIDAFTGVTPDPQVAQKVDGATVWSMDQAPEFQGMIQSVHVMSKDAVQKDPSKAQHYVNALMKAWRYQQANPADAEEIAVAGMGGNPDATRLSYESSAPALKLGPKPDPQKYELVRKVLELSSGKPAPITLDQAFNTTFATQAEAATRP